LLFVLTSSHWEYMELILSTTLGEDWRSLFDLVCADGRKPRFFSERNPAYLMD
jgi:hypothetical protein